MSNDDGHPTIEERQQARSDFLLGRDGREKPPSERDEMAAAMKALRDPDGGGVSDHLGVKYRDEGGRNYTHHKYLHDDLKTEQREEAERKQEREAEEKRKEETDARLERKQAGRWSQQDQAALEQIGQRAQNYQRAVAEYQQAASLPADQQPGWFRDPSMRQQAEALLQAEQADLQAAEQQVRAAAARKQQQAGLAQLPEQLQNGEERDQFVDWLEEQGYPRDAIEAETDPVKLSVAFKKYKDAKREASERQKRTRIADHSKKLDWSRRGGVPQDSKEARDKLRRSGSMRDAQNLLTLKRLERTL